MMGSIVSRAIQPAHLNPRGSWQNKKSNKIIKWASNTFLSEIFKYKAFLTPNTHRNTLLLTARLAWYLKWGE